MSELLEPTGIPIMVGANKEPSGRQNMKELEIPAFCRRYCMNWFDHEKLKGWWL
jgi:hypothetical protein